MISGKLFLNFKILLYLQQLKKNFPFQQEKIYSLQLKKLKKLLIHAYENFDFYRERMNGVHFDPYQLRSLDDLKQIPSIGKEDYRAFTEAVVLKNPQKYKHYYIDKTSGSTGMPLMIYRTWNERAYMLAKFLRALFVNGYKITDRTYSLPSPMRASKRDSIVQKLGLLKRYTVFFNETPENLVKGYIDSAADIFYANKSQLVLMALHILDHNIKIHKPKFYVSSAETMDSNSRRIIEQVFGKDLIEIYGAIEFNNLGFQKLGNDYIDFNHDTNILELDSDGQIQEKEGYCIITDLHIYSFPLIRYRLGDYIETAKKDGITVIQSIQGRIDDCVILRDGTRRPYAFFYYTISPMLEARQIRFIQESYDLIVAEVVLNPGVNRSEFENYLIRELRQKISDQISYQVVYKTALEPDPGGKIRMLISKVKSE